MEQGTTDAKPSEKSCLHELFRGAKEEPTMWNECRAEFIQAMLSHEEENNEIVKTTKLLEGRKEQNYINN